MEVLSADSAPYRDVLLRNAVPCCRSMIPAALRFGLMPSLVQANIFGWRVCLVYCGRGEALGCRGIPALNQWSIAEAVINQTPPSPLSRPARDDDPPLKKNPLTPTDQGEEEKKRHHLFRLASANHSAPSPPSLPARSTPGRATPRGARSLVPITPAARSPRTPVCTPPHTSPPRF